MSQNEYVFAVVLKAKGHSPEDAWQSAVTMFATDPGNCPELWMLENERPDAQQDQVMSNLAA